MQFRNYKQEFVRTLQAAALAVVSVALLSSLLIFLS